MRVFLLVGLAITVGFSTAEEPVLREARGITYATFGDREVLLDWFRPDDQVIYPGIVLIHGGGWIGGKREAFETTARDLAKEGFVVANIDYRLATEAKFPGAVLDSKAAVRWLRANAESLGVDSERIAAVGGSAGGHLAAMVASTAGEDAFADDGNHPSESDAVQALIIMGAGVDQVARVKETRKGSVKNCVIFFGGELDEVPEIYEAGSPITHVGEGTPPVLMLDGGEDNPGARYVEYRRKLDLASVRNEFVEIPGAKHGQWAKAEYRPLFVSAMVEFLRSVFQQ